MTQFLQIVRRHGTLGCDQQRRIGEQHHRFEVGGHVIV
jgi:hypothetical protein